MKRPIHQVRLRLSLLLVLVISIQPARSIAQKQAEVPETTCDRQRGLLLVQQQVDEAKTIDSPISQISIMLQAADLLWPYQEETARAIFTRAYELAEKYFQERGAESRKEGKLTILLEDQRFAVMSRIARHDPAWARRLAERTTEITKRETEEAVTTTKQTDSIESLIGLAEAILSADKQTAINLVKHSFRYPATASLARFLFKLAESDQAAADSLYLLVLEKYATATVRELLYLSPYPFGLNRVVGPEAQSTGFSVPSEFVTNPRLQQSFLEALFQRAHKTLKAPSEPAGGAFNLPEPAQAYFALTELESVIGQHQPSYAPRASEIKAMLGAALYSDVRINVDAILSKRSSTQGNGFESYIEQAEKVVGDEKRDQLLALALLNAPNDESLDRLLGLAKKISDLKLRQQLLNHLYFTQTQKAIQKGLLDDAKYLAEKVEPLDQRAYLFYEIAAQALKQLDDKQRASELLDAVALAASKASKSNEKARTLLGVSYLYTKFDRLRAFEVMTDAIKTINQIENPDFSSQTLHRRIEGATFAQYTFYKVAGFSLEIVFRALGSLDFDGALYLAKSLDSKVLRATAIIALSAFCLEKARLQDKKSVRPGKNREKSGTAIKPKAP